MKKVYIQTFGCQMNMADSDEMMLHLAARGCIGARDMEEADIVLLNTCTVREHAEHRAVSFLGRLAKWKSAKKGRVIIFAGCAAQRLGRGLRRRFPQTDIIAGAKDIDGFGGILDKSGLFGAAAGGGAGAAGAGITGLVNITRGCSCRCSYCIVPYVRGEAYSINPDDILAAASRKIAAGAKEIMLLGQTVNGYNYKGKNFCSLLRDIASLKGLLRLRFMSPHPVFIDEEFIKTAVAEPKISRHVHLPAQSGSDKVLADMKRGYDRRAFLRKTEMLRGAGIAVSTDIIAGYPTETEEDFCQTLSLVDEAAFTAAYCFKFSPRALTPAAALAPLDDKIVEKRLDILLNKVKTASAAAYAAQPGTKQAVLFETPTNGRTSTNFWVRTSKKYAAGELAEVEIKEAEDTILLA
ncbi:MAG: MiaB/RimO family radical SAM methylthiotransferase [Elusimicrobiota bacterium]|nr:MiaB/RimO family radical SAM methylthiotransferase [Elusimicrobiota bacterium]